MDLAELIAQSINQTGADPVPAQDVMALPVIVYGTNGDRLGPVGGVSADRKEIRLWLAIEDDRVTVARLADLVERVYRVDQEGDPVEGEGNDVPTVDRR